MQNIFYLLKISRPRFWMYVFGPFLVGAAAAATVCKDLPDWPTLIFGIYFLFPANLLIYGINDIFDYETDKLNAKKEGYEITVNADKRKFLWAMILIFNMPFIAAAFLFAKQGTIGLAGFLFFSIFYSAPPIRAKTKPFLDSAFNVLYIFPAVFAYQTLTGENPLRQPFIASTIWAAAMHAYSAVPDIESDKRAGFKTTATVSGANSTIILCLILYLLSAVLSFQYIGFLSAVLGFIYTTMMLVSLKMNRTGEIFKVYKFFPLINTISGFLLFWKIFLPKCF